MILWWFFTTPAISRMKFIGDGRAGRGWGGRGWEAKGGQYHPQGGKQQCRAFSRAHKLPQSTWQDQTVVSSSLTPQAALLVPISGPMDSVVDRRGFTRLAKDRL